MSFPFIVFVISVAYVLLLWVSVFRNSKKIDLATRCTFNRVTPEQWAERSNRMRSERSEDWVK